MAGALCPAAGTVGPVTRTIGTVNGILGSGDVSINLVDAAIMKVTLLKNYQCMLQQCTIM